MDLTAPLPLNKITKHLPIFSVYQVFLYSLSAILVIVLDKNIAKNVINFCLQEYIQVDSNIENFFLIIPFLAGALFFIFSSFILSFLILSKKTNLDKPKVWLLYGFAGFYSAIVGFWCASYKLENMNFQSILDYVYLAYFLLIIAQGLYIFLLLFAPQDTSGVSENQIELGEFVPAYFLATSSIVVILWVATGLYFLKTEWYLIVGSLFLVINILTYIKKLMPKL